MFYDEAIPHALHAAIALRVLANPTVTSFDLKDVGYLKNFQLATYDMWATKNEELFICREAARKAITNTAFRETLKPRALYHKMFSPITT